MQIKRRTSEEGRTILFFSAEGSEKYEESVRWLYNKSRTGYFRCDGFGVRLMDEDENAGTDNLLPKDTSYEKLLEQYDSKKTRALYMIGTYDGRPMCIGIDFSINEKFIVVKSGDAATAVVAAEKM